jgi:lipid-A-disaccharide synthase
VIQKILISSGDTSGDNHAAGLCRALQAAIPGITIAGIGDTALADTGATLLATQDGMRQVGTIGLVRSVPHHWQLAKKLLNYITHENPDVIILVDYGGFHLRVAKAIRQQLPAWSGKLVYFIPPQLWASRPYRIKTMQRTVDLVLGILPFEAPIYQHHGIPYQFVGHPVTAALPPPPSVRAAACQQLGLSAEQPIVAVFPGSRSMELNYLLPVLKQTLPLIQAACTAPIQFVFAEAPGVHLKTTLADWGFGPWLSLHCVQDSHTLQAIAHAAIVKSGTSTLETAWYGTPQVIIYKGHWTSFWVVKTLATVPCLGLPNLLLMPDWQRPETPLPIPECLQQQLTPANLTRIVLDLLNTASPGYARQKQASAQLHQQLSQQASPYTMAAQAILAFTD